MGSTSKLEGRVALITGAGRGQGRQHAVRLAAEGADIIALDICRDYATTSYPMATSDDLQHTASLVEQLGRRCVVASADVRNHDQMKVAVDRSVDELGRLDVVCANAGICIANGWEAVTPAAWSDVIDTNLTGTWNTAVASIPHLIASGGGSIVLISSTGGLKGLPFLAPYVASKHGVMGIAKTLANELAEHSIRVNTVNPSHVNTPMMEAMRTDLGPIVETNPDLGAIFMTSLAVSEIDSDDISNVVVFLASDESRYITGATIAVDAGATAR